MNFNQITKSRLLNGIVVALSLITILISLQSYGTGKYISNGIVESNFNNFLIFKASATNLLNNIDLYILHPTQHYDLYKYSPTFALFMLPFSVFPDWLGLIFWNLLNLTLFICALKMLPGLNKPQMILILLVGVFELIGSMMNEQSNVLMTGLMLLSIAQFERKNAFWGIFFLVLSVYIKLFSIVLFMLVLFYPNRARSAIYSIFWFLILGLIPSLFIGLDDLKMQYMSWFYMLQNDYDASVGYSIIGILDTWFSISGNRLHVLILGGIIMCLPLLKVSQFKKRHYRYSVLSALLIWIIIFNHKAESPTFIIAMTGIGLYFSINKFTTSNKILLGFCIIFVSLVYSDIMPPKYRDSFFHPYFIKAFPCIIIWLKIMTETILDKFIIFTRMALKLLAILLFDQQYNKLTRQNVPTFHY